MPKLVLIVDDDPAQRRILEETIRQLGFETRCAQGGEQALQILDSADRAAIALVLLDLVMPGMDGIEVLRRVAAKPGRPPIIVQTAHGSIDAAITAMRAGAVDFVVKPSSPERLEFERACDRHLEPLRRRRLDDEIDRARAHRHDGGIDRSVRGLHDDRRPAGLGRMVRSHRGNTVISGDGATTYLATQLAQWTPIPPPPLGRAESHFAAGCLCHDHHATTLR